LDDLAWIALDDDVFTEWCCKFFGPANKKEAQRMLKAVKIYHSDVVDSQALFLGKLDAASYEHELIVNDISDCCDMWPTDPDDIECSALDAKEIQKCWLGIFPKQEGKVFSVQMKKCRDYIEANPHEPFNIQIQKLRSYFAKKDKQVKVGDDVYSTMPSKTRSNRTRVSDSSFYAPDDSRHSRPSSGGAVKRAFSETNPRRYRAQNAAVETAVDHSKMRIVPGHARGMSCGSINNHFGLGCSKDTCPVFGTKHDKSLKKTHVWKSNDVEPSVRLEASEYKALMTKNPKIAENWKMARNQTRRPHQGAKVSALNANENDSDDFDQDDIDDQSGMPTDNESSDNSEDEVNSKLYLDCDNDVQLAAAKVDPKHFGI
jgi:hypothetical protein